ncbi:uncharacterized protein N7458_001420 [Penicillium daleae]|uniref:Pre-mRNA-splicing factor 38B n=1 Tax=Penicillium daleae TaxID=63821 RepID=A0AAD6CB63_9EURO|nr:uncharacterized protein N7458_001420 [Penicillium daleae]KAJ5459868.1 hypothetical protein N7458_001420 [Penicillium daleae]
MDDDYVVEVLAREARDSSQRYRTDGLSAYMPQRPTGNAPKPNTRFLRHLIKETDSHNTSLKRKEEREARDRLRHLRSHPQDLSTSKSTPSTRRPDPRSSTSELARSHGEEQRVRSSRDQHESRSRRRHHARDLCAERDRSIRPDLRDESRGRSSRDHRARRERSQDRHASPQNPRSGRGRPRSRSRSRSPRRDRSSGHRSHPNTRRSKSPSNKQSHSRRSRTERRSEGTERHRDRLPLKSHSSSTRTSTNPRKQTQESPSISTTPSTLRRDYPEDDSDPLEDLVGPLPPHIHGEGAAPIISRGRGAYKPSASAIDAHFAPDYDPTDDLPSDDDRVTSLNKSSRRPVAGLMTADDDWDMALEALRDRQRWKQKGEERLRAAGMNEVTIDRWKNNAAFTGAASNEDNPENVRWAKKGEGREWDRGKVMDEDGHIDVRAAW